MRWVSTLVLPDPAPATMSSGPPSWSTASRCCGLRPRISASASGKRGGASSGWSSRGGTTSGSPDGSPGCGAWVAGRCSNSDVMAPSG